MGVSVKKGRERSTLTVFYKLSKQIWRFFWDLPVKDKELICNTLSHYYRWRNGGYWQDPKSLPVLCLDWQTDICYKSKVGLYVEIFFKIHILSVKRLAGMWKGFPARKIIQQQMYKENMQLEDYQQNRKRARVSDKSHVFEMKNAADRSSKGII